MVISKNRPPGERPRCLQCQVSTPEHCLDVAPDRLIQVRRRIRPAHGKNMTGRVPLRRVGSVEYESALERNFLLWIRGCSHLVDVVEQPLLVAGWFGGSYRRYTPDFLVTLRQIPRDLKALGFGARTIVEVKPAVFAGDVEVRQKLCLARKVTGLPAVIVTELDVTLPLTEETAHVN